MLGSGPSEVHMPYVFANKVPKDSLTQIKKSTIPIMTIKTADAYLM